MKLCFSTLGCPDWSIERVVEQAVKNGCAGVELRGFEKRHISPSADKGYKDYVKMLFETNRLELPVITAYTKFSSPSPAELRENEKILIEYCELAAYMGAQYVRTFIGYPPEGTEDAQVYRNTVESLNRIASDIRGLGVMALIELHDFVSTAGRVKNITDYIDTGSVAVLWDTCHSVRNGEDAAQTVALLGGLIRHLHIKDYNGSDENGKPQYLSVGAGIMPIQEIMDLMDKNGYGGYYSLEWEKAWHPHLAELEDELPSYVRYMRSLRDGK